MMGWLQALFVIVTLWILFVRQHKQLEFEIESIRNLLRFLHDRQQVLEDKFHHIKEDVKETEKE